MNIVNFGTGILTFERFLSANECAQYMVLSEQIGYHESEIITATGASEIFKGIRNNDRVIFDDPVLAATLYERARPHLPPEVGGWTLHGFNERLRFYRYGPGEYFKWHRDGAYVRSADEESLLTFMVYLNADFEGGKTEFKWETIAPQQGMALVFPHRHLHQGATVASGAKYVLRTDVMYRRGTANKHHEQRVNI